MKIFIGLLFLLGVSLIPYNHGQPIESSVDVSEKPIWEGKRYQRSTVLNFEEYMRKLGVGFSARKLYNTIQPIIELQKSGDKYTLITTSTYENSEVTFELGNEFDEVTLDGRRVRSVITLNGNRMLHKQGGIPGSVIVRYFGETEMVAYMKADEVISICEYTAVGL